MSEIKVITNILNSNNKISFDLKKFFKEKGIYVINLMSSPGAGKTSILEKLISKLKDDIKIAVIEGDIYTTKDAERIGVLGVPVVQINTGGACHLDGSMIKSAVDNLDSNNIDILIIENVGNLVCPAEFEIGEDMKVSVLSVTEGNDKPSKYPLMFEKSAAVILNKLDLAEYTNFSIPEFYDDLKAINANAKIFETSCVKNQGIEEISLWLKNNLKIKREVI